jgi:predicted transcriptional regulator
LEDGGFFRAPDTVMLLQSNTAGSLETLQMTGKKRISVKDVMKTDFSIIDGKATIMDALNEMKRLQTAVLVVDKKDEHDEYGLILVSDIARQVLARDKAPSRMNIYEIMTKPAVCVPPDMDIRYCSRLMSSLNLTRVLVVKDDELLGTVSPRALVLEGLVAIELDT